MRDLKDIQLEYHQKELRRESLAPHPYAQLNKWLDDVEKEEISYPNAATLSTVGKDFIPSSRIVLIKEVDEEGLIFFTDYRSEKGRQIAENPYASLLFFWKELDRQIRITGSIQKTPRDFSEKYFSSRPHLSQVSAYSSYQSHPTTHSELADNIKSTSLKYPEDVPCPPDWGGYQLSFNTVEFWQGRPNRLHDRFKYRKENETWVIERLSP